MSDPTTPRAVAALPVEHPREFATALGRTTMEIWGPPGMEPQRSRGWIPSFICPLARNALELILRGDVRRRCDLLVAPHTCDSFQTLATQVLDLGAGGLDCVPFYHPRTLDPDARAAFLRDELRRFRSEMERRLGAIPDDRLRDAVEIHRESDRLAHRLLREGPREGLSEVERYAILRKRERSPAAEANAAMREALRRPVDPAPKGAPVMVSGIVPEPPGLLEAIAAANVRIAFDDFAGLGRRIPETLPDPTGDPIEDIARRWESLPPCSTRTMEPAKRIDWITGHARAAGVRGALFVVVARCEPELFDLPAVREALHAAGIQSAVIDTDLEPALPAALQTRIDAFGEMVASGARG